jgi:FAD/FMN-containing dehydrogenase
MLRQTLEGGGVERLQAALKGSILVPGDEGYDETRKVYIEGIDRRPAAIVRVANAADVAHVVTLARESGVPLAVRSGGHSFAGFGTCDGGWVIDLREMKGLEIDVDGRTAWAQTGLTAGDYTAAVGAHGLATPFGDNPTVGLGGLTLGGGVGFLHRKLGLTIDSVLAAEVVTSDGSIVRADAATHPDLFWAIRGGGGNFGVVTRILYRLHEVSEIVGGMLILPAEAEGIVRFVEALLEAPEEMSGIAAVMKAPPMPFIPVELVSRPILFAVLVYAGSAEAGARAFAPLRSIATPLADTLAPMRYPELFQGPEGPHHVGISFRSVYRETVDRAAADSVLERVMTSDATMSGVQFRVLGGAVARVPAGATAFAHRDRAMIVNVFASYPDPARAPEYDAWVDAFAEQVGQGEPGAFANFVSSEGRARDVYPGETWERLKRVKAEYDPGNLFRYNVNVS